MFLSTDRESIVAGDTVTLTTSPGVPGTLTLTIVSKINLVPCHCPLFGLGVFDAAGVRSVSTTFLGPSSPPTRVQLQAYTLDGSGKLLESAPVQIRLR